MILVPGFAFLRKTVMGNKAATPLPAYESISRRFSAKELERIKDTFSSMAK